MTVSMFMTMLAAFATITGLLTEAVKSILDERGVVYSANLLACIIGCVVGVAGTVCWYTFAKIAITPDSIVSMMLMGLASAVGAMVGYDKIIQMVGQLK